MKPAKILGIIFLTFGFILILNSLSGITGFTIAEQINKKTSSLLGSALTIIGIIFIVFTRERPSQLEIIETDTFKRQTRKVDPKVISTAVNKIGTGLGKEHALHGNLASSYAVKTSKGGRIVYSVKNGGVFLEKYLPSHNYH